MSMALMQPHSHQIAVADPLRLSSLVGQEDMCCILHLWVPINSLEVPSQCQLAQPMMPIVLSGLFVLHFRALLLSSWLTLGVLLSFQLLLVSHDGAPCALRHHQGQLQHSIHAHSGYANCAKCCAVYCPTLSGSSSRRIKCQIAFSRAG